MPGLLPCLRVQGLAAQMCWCCAFKPPHEVLHAAVRNLVCLPSIAAVWSSGGLAQAGTSVPQSVRSEEQCQRTEMLETSRFPVPLHSAPCHATGARAAAIILAQSVLARKLPIKLIHKCRADGYTGSFARTRVLPLCHLFKSRRQIE